MGESQPFTGLTMSVPDGFTFLKRHQTALVQRLKSVGSVLEHLREQNVISEFLEHSVSLGQYRGTNWSLFGQIQFLTEIGGGLHKLFWIYLLFNLRNSNRYVVFIVGPASYSRSYSRYSRSLTGCCALLIFG